MKPYLSQFDVEKLEMASVMGICGSLVGPKSENVEKPLVFACFVEGQSGDEYSREELQTLSPESLGGHWGSLGGHLAVTLKNDAYTWGLGGTKKRKC